MLQLILTHDGKELVTQPINSEKITIGRAECNTLQLKDPTISRMHCLIERKNDDIVITDLSRNGTFVNGAQVSSAQLRLGDTVKIGPWLAHVAEITSPVSPTVVEHAEPTSVLSFNDETGLLTEEKIFLEVISPEQRPQKLELSRAEITFGSGVTCTVTIADPYVSRAHCKLVSKPSGLTLTDLGSTNGTHIDGARVSRVSLPHCGTFSIGKTTVRYSTSKITEKIAPSEEPALGSMLGQSRIMREVFSLIKKAAPSDVAVCILGESGTGKELAARELHNLSHRREKPFVAINCGALPVTIIESMLFGHERGAFTGAVERQAGVFEQADGGTLFLDEIGEMEMGLQARLLRILEERTLRRLGGREDIPFDIRLVIATNRNLKQLVLDGRFREDLFYRLYVLPIHLPPLRARKEDILQLADHFLKVQASEGKIMRLNDAAKEILLKHEWRGNVRELKNVLLRATVTAKSDFIESSDIELIGVPKTDSDEAAEQEKEREAILDALRTTGGNQTLAAKILGIARSTLSFKIGRYGINPKET